MYTMFKKYFEAQKCLKTWFWATLLAWPAFLWFFAAPSEMIELIFMAYQTKTTLLAFTIIRWIPAGIAVIVILAHAIYAFYETRARLWHTDWKFL